jgi:hypothetical protein
VPVFAQEKEEVNPKILAAIQANDKAYVTPSTNMMLPVSRHSSPRTQY